LAPRFQRLDEFLGTLFLILLIPMPAFLSGPTPLPPSPIPRDKPSEDPKS